MNGEEPMLAIEHVTKTYGSKRALDDVSITVMPGDIYGFIGRNGAGKTTLIRSIVGIAGFDGGNVRINGISVIEDPLSCKGMTAYVPDNPDIYEFLTGMQYLDYIADVFRVPRDIRRERVESYAGRFGLTPVLGDLISSYSHGMKQKTVLIGALLHNPKLLVLDEPFVGLDPEASYELKKIMRESTAEGCAIFFSSHVLDVVEKLCDKVAIIEAGRLRGNGRTADIVGDRSLETAFLDMEKEALPHAEPVASR